MMQSQEPVAVDAHIKTLFSGSADVAEGEEEGEVVWMVEYNRYGLTAWRRAVGGQIYTMQEPEVVLRWGGDLCAELVCKITRGEVIAYGHEFAA